MLQYPYIERTVQLMLTQEDLQAISQLIKNEVEQINKRFDKMDIRLDKIEEDIEIIKEDAAITRDVTNKLGEWVDFYFHDDKPYPLDEDEVEKYKNRIKFAK